MNLCMDRRSGIAERELAPRYTKMRANGNALGHGLKQTIQFFGGLTSAVLCSICVLRVVYLFFYAEGFSIHDPVWAGGWRWDLIVVGEHR